MHVKNLKIKSRFIKDLLALPGPVVIAHRGGNWAPDNSIANFKASLKNKVQAVESDVWLSKDGVAMILHGDSDG